MSAGYWPQWVAKTLNQSEIGDFLKAQMQDVPLEAFINLDINS